MPLYEYILPDGTKAVRQCSVDKRDSFPGWKRITVPDTVRVLTGSAPDPFVSSVMQGYKRMEEKGGSRFSSSYTKQQIRDAWAT
jgi:hypothetical protein